MTEQNAHVLTVTDRKKTCVTGVSEVDGVTSEKITFTLIGDKRMIIQGENLKMAGFSKQSATLLIDGTVNEIRYAGAKGNLLKKLVK